MINVCEQVYNFILLMRLGELFFVLLVHGDAQVTLIRIRQPKTIKLNCIEGREILFKLNFLNYWARCYMGSMRFCYDERGRFIGEAVWLIEKRESYTNDDKDLIIF